MGLEYPGLVRNRYNQLTTSFQYPADLGQGQAFILYMLQNVIADYQVEVAVLKGQVPPSVMHRVNIIDVMAGEVFAKDVQVGPVDIYSIYLAILISE